MDGRRQVCRVELSPKDCRLHLKMHGNYIKKNIHHSETGEKDDIKQKVKQTLSRAQKIQKKKK